MNTENMLVWALRLAGAGQLFVALIYFQLRRIVGWDADVAKLRPLNRAITQTYSRYIQAFNAVFGLMCLLPPRELLTGTPRARDLTLVIALYWGVRFVLGLTYYDTREFTRRPLYRFAEIGFAILFAFQSATLFSAFAYNLP